MLIVPFPLKFIPRLELSVNPAVVWRVPPLKIKWFDSTDPGTAPKLSSELILSVPPLIVFVPVIELVPDNVRV